jgi:D-alanine-D-alanine ligase
MQAGKAAADLCSSSMTQYFVAEYFRTGHWEGYLTGCARSTAGGATRCSTRWPSTSPPRRRGPGRRAGLFVWATLPEGLDTTDLLAKALGRNVAFVPGRAAYLDGRGGTSMRLNFSGVGEDDIREGVRRHRRGRARAGGAARDAHGPRAVRAGGARRARRGARRPVERRGASSPPRGRPATALGRPAAGVSRIAVLKGGRSLERQVSLHSGARVQDALERLGHDVVPIDVGHDLVARLRDEAPDACFIALHGRDGEDGTVQELLELLAIPYTGSRPGACARCADKVLAKQAMRRAGIPTPDFLSFGEAAFKVLGATEALPLAGDRLGFPLVVKPADQGSALGLRVAAGAAELPAALVAAFSYSGKVLLERRISGRDLAVSVLDGEALPVVEAIPEGPDPYAARYEVGGTRFACPAALPTR